MNAESLDKILNQTWFYRFVLPDGRVTQSYDDGALDAVHDTRLRMLEAVLSSRFGASLGGGQGHRPRLPSGLVCQQNGGARRR
ncbi:MAG TPA: hypothetical protein VFN09_03900 [Rhodanobacteraceae bacterium]|nr:hypothetical protein [Rhodanobacteraceae bacterium]